MMVKWPGKIKPGQVSNEIISMEDWLPTFVAAAGDSNIKEKLLKGHKAGDMTYKVHLDGYNMIPYFTGQVKEGPREEMYYFTDGGSLSSFRYQDWKLMFSTGSEMYLGEEAKERFVFQPGPIFANIVLADEVNRAPAKVQAPLLEAMRFEITDLRTSHIQGACRLSQGGRLVMKP